MRCAQNARFHLVQHTDSAMHLGRNIIIIIIQDSKVEAKPTSKIITLVFLIDYLENNMRHIV